MEVSIDEMRYELMEAARLNVEMMDEEEVKAEYKTITAPLQSFTPCEEIRLIDELLQQRRDELETMVEADGVGALKAEFNHVTGCEWEGE